MKAERTTRRHTPLPNTGTRASNRIAAKKETKGTKRAGSSQKNVPSAPREPSSSQETINNSSGSSRRTPSSSFSSYNTNDGHPNGGLEGTLTLPRRNPQVHGAVVMSSNPSNNGAGSDTPIHTAGEVALETYGNRIVIDSTLAKKLAGEPSLRPIRQRRSDMDLNMERRSNVEAFLAHLTGVQ
ncbi:hypothetical protein FCIRC_12037, partial [Fusarium circinatum]